MNNLKKLIENNNINEAIIKIEEISEQKYADAFPLLVEYLMKTDNHLLRNSIALALMDIGNPEAVEPIIELLKDQKTLGYRGTLLYALEPFDYSAHIELLIDFVVNGNYEVRHKSKGLIEGMKPNIKDETLLESIIQIKRSIDEFEDKHTVLLETLDALCNFKKF